MARRKGQRTVKRGERRPSEAPESDEGPDADELGESSTVQAKLDMAEVGEDADEAEAGEVEAEAASERSPDSVLEPELTPEPRQIGRYQLLFELARGGMGTVHVGRQTGAHGFDRPWGREPPQPARSPQGAQRPRRARPHLLRSPCGFPGIRI